MERLAEALARRVPQRDVQRRDSQVEQPARADPRAGARQLLPRRLHLEHVQADQLGGQLARRLRDRADQGLARRDDVAVAAHAVAGLDPGEDVPVARDRPAARGVRSRHRHAQDEDLGAGNLHWASAPPSITISLPVTHAESSEAR